MLIYAILFSGAIRLMAFPLLIGFGPLLTHHRDRCSVFMIVFTAFWHQDHLHSGWIITVYLTCSDSNCKVYPADSFTLSSSYSSGNAKKRWLSKYPRPDPPGEISLIFDLAVWQLVGKKKRQGKVHLMQELAESFWLSRYQLLQKLQRFCNVWDSYGLDPWVPHQWYWISFVCSPSPPMIPRVFHTYQPLNL